MFEVTPAALNERGISLLLLDMDNTLKEHYAQAPSPQVLAWLEALKAAGIQLAIVSNGRPARVAHWTKVFNVPGFSLARKPLPFVCRRAVAQFGVSPQAAALLGDQVFTDMLAGRWAGIYTILVTPISSDEPWYIRVKRPLERLLLGKHAPAVPPGESRV